MLYVYVKVEWELGVVECRICGGCRDGYCSLFVVGDLGLGVLVGFEVVVVCNVIVNGMCGVVVVVEGVKSVELFFE